jgi:uncharacterized protein (TIGR02147 family)
MAERTRPAPFDYLDYRGFLRDYYIAEKQAHGLSYRTFAKLAGIKSPNYLKLVIDGDRNLSSEMAARFAEAIELEGDEREFFLELVKFGQAKSERDRNASYARITGFQRYQEAQPLEVAQAAYHSQWYLPAVRELASAKGFRNDPAWIASHLIPEITPEQAASAVRALLDLGLLRRDGDHLVQGSGLVSTGPETRRLHIVNYHRAMMQQASESMDTIPPEDRDISALTLCVSDDGLRRMKERIQRFRRELLELSVLEDAPRQVVQINFQLFPVSKVCEDEE